VKVIVYDLNTKAIESLHAEFPEKIVKARSSREVFCQAVSVYDFHLRRELFREADPVT